MADRGARSIMGLGRAFRIYDDNRNGHLDREEALKAYKTMRLGLSDSDCLRLFKIFDRDGNGQIDYEEFLRTVRGSMNEFRTKLVVLAFRIMDKNGSGVIDIDDVRSIYSCKKHPDVISKKKTED
jgi:Ca2+-binding EF-hand superfamily protein